MTIEVTFDENTLRKVYEALLENGIYGQKALDIVNSMQNRGILFREGVKAKRGRPQGSTNKTQKDPWTPKEESNQEVVKND